MVTTVDGRECVPCIPAKLRKVCTKDRIDANDAKRKFTDASRIVRQCQSDLNSHKGALNDSRMTVVALFDSNNRLKKENAELRNRWRWFKWMGVGMMGAGCGTMIGGFFDQPPGPRATIIGALMCMGGSMMFLWG